MSKKKKLFERPCPSCGWTTSNSEDHASFHATQAEEQNKKAKDQFNQRVDDQAEYLREKASSSTQSNIEHMRSFITWMNNKGEQHTPDFVAAKRVLSENQFKYNEELTAKVYDNKNNLNKIARSKNGQAPA